MPKPWRDGDRDPWGHDGFDPLLDDYCLPQHTRAGRLGALFTVVASSAIVAYVGWFAWELLEQGRVGDLLILSAILIAWPAWHAIDKALRAEKGR